MFAVLKTGGKQYKVQAGDVLRVEKLDAVAGEKIQFNDILMVGTTDRRAPMVAGAAVQAEVIDQIKGEKTIHYVKRRRKHSSPAHQGPPPAPDAGPRDRVLEKGADKSGVKAATGTAAARRAAHEAPGAKPAAPVAEKPKRAAKAAAVQE
jgi:large subunit ribosomal protein L21